MLIILLLAFLGFGFYVIDTVRLYFYLEEGEQLILDLFDLAAVLLFLACGSVLTYNLL